MLLQPITLALNRSDYMIGSEEDTHDIPRTAEQTDVMSAAYTLTFVSDAPPDIKLYQIEFNTMAASFAALSQNLTSYHR